MAPLARWCFWHRFAVLALWIAGLLVLGGLSRAAGDRYSDSFSLPGIGLGGAVLLDAFVLRTVLVPALMHKIGPANWWLPRRLDRALPHLSVEPAEPEAVRA